MTQQDNEEKQDMALVFDLLATKIQQWWRKILLKRQEEYLNKMMIESIQKDAVLKIQATYRGMQGRQLFQRKRQDFELKIMKNIQHDSATKLQASFRGYRDRKDIQSKPDSPIHNLGQARLRTFSCLPVRTPF